MTIHILSAQPSDQIAAGEVVVPPAEQDEGWLVYAEGRDMSPVVQPASHPQGTTVCEGLDLFYNSPFRRPFLKSDRT